MNTIKLKDQVVIDGNGYGLDYESRQLIHLEKPDMKYSFDIFRMHEKGKPYVCFHEGKLLDPQFVTDRYILKTLAPPEIFRESFHEKKDWIDSINKDRGYYSCRLIDEINRLRIEEGRLPQMTIMQEKWQVDGRSFRLTNVNDPYWSFSLANKVVEDQLEEWIYFLYYPKARTGIPTPSLNELKTYPAGGFLIKTWEDVILDPVGVSLKNGRSPYALLNDFIVSDNNRGVVVDFNKQYYMSHIKQNRERMNIQPADNSPARKQKRQGL